MTIVHRWTVTVSATGDRPVTDEEVSRLGALVGPAGGTASSTGTHGYSVSLVLAAGTREEACSIATTAVATAASRAGLPDWPVRCTAEGDGPPGGAGLGAPPTGRAAADPDPLHNPELGER